MAQVSESQDCIMKVFDFLARSSNSFIPTTVIAKGIEYNGKLFHLEDELRESSFNGCLEYHCSKSVGPMYKIEEKGLEILKGEQAKKS